MRQLGTQMSGVTSISGHLGETSRDFSEGFGPSGGGISHHSNIVSHISEVLSEGNSSVDGGFSSGDGHVGGVSDQAGSLHDIVLLSVNPGGERGEIVEHFSHLVSTLATSDVDNALRVRVLGQGLGDAGLTTSESSGNSASSTLDGGEEGIEHTLSSQKGSVSSKLLSHGSGVTDGPEVGHGELGNFTIGVLDSANGVSDAVLSLGHNLSDSSVDTGRDHDFMRREEVVLIGGSENISTNNSITRLDIAGGESPKSILVQGRHIDSTRDEDITGQVILGLALLCDSLEGPLNSIEDSLQNTWSQFYRKRFVGPEHGISNGQAGCVLVALD